MKVDSRYTANTQIVKLVGTHTIAKVTLRISDLKRTKMVRTVNFYYNNRTVQSVVELKNKWVIIELEKQNFHDINYICSINYTSWFAMGKIGLNLLKI